MTLRRQRKDPKRFAAPGAGILAGLAAIAGLVVLLRKRGNELKGAALDATESVRKPNAAYDDVTLARKVESEIFRDVDAPKGAVVVNGRDGVVELRGTVESQEQVEALGDAAKKVTGVSGVNNLLSAS